MEGEHIEGQGVLHALRRRWKWVVVGALAGLALAILLTALMPKKYTATVDVQLFSSDDGSIERASRMQTEAALAQSVPVAERALEKLNSSADPETLLKSYRATPFTDDLLRFDATGRTAELAAARVTAVARGVPRLHRSGSRLGAGRGRAFGPGPHHPAPRPHRRARGGDRRAQQRGVVDA